MKHLADIEFIEAHKNDLLIDVALLLSKQKTFDKEFILAQINGIQKAKSKIQEFYDTRNIIYPTKLSLEQCSSEKTGIYKSQLINGKTLVDLTGGFGVDSFYLDKEYEQVTYIEQNTELYKTVKHNFGLLKATNIKLVNSTAEEFIKNNTQEFDVVYIDPSRRNQNKRVFKLDECSPNIIELAPELFQFSDKILIKTAPLLDIKQTLKDLKNVSDKEYVVIDGSPQATSLAISAIKAADFILIPVQPSPYDIWATSDLVDLVQQRIEMMDGQLKAAFVVSRAIQNTNIGKEVATALLDYNIPVLETRVMQRVAYPNSAALGKTVFDTESPSSNAIQEITALVSEIQIFFGEE